MSSSENNTKTSKTNINPSNGFEELIEKVEALGFAALNDLEGIKDLSAIEDLRLRVFGKKGSMAEVMKAMGTLSVEDRPKLGTVANHWKTKVESAISEKKQNLENAELVLKLQKESIDISMPSRRQYKGSLHPVTQVTQRICNILGRIGFDVVTGPEIETEYLNFDAVNIPAHHPARDMQDTFFMGPGVVLRTHTSAVQMRAMRTRDWPLRVLCPGAVYRNDYDATHTPMFHQIEGLWIDQGVKMSDLKGVLSFFAQEMFGSDTQIRLRPSYFPFVEPGAEVDVSCFQCRKKIQPECRICKGTGWLEILGAGMVHPKLFELANEGRVNSGLKLYDSSVTGFAFGMGLERIAMLAFEIPDLRMMFEGDIRFSSQF